VALFAVEESTGGEKAGAGATGVGNGGTVIDTVVPARSRDAAAEGVVGENVVALAKYKRSTRTSWDSVEWCAAEACAALTNLPKMRESALSLRRRR
jgi:hypothetical protein